MKLNNFKFNFDQEELAQIERFLAKKIWHGHHKMMEEDIFGGGIYVVPDEDYEEFVEDVPYFAIRESDWEQTVKASTVIEFELGTNNFGPQNDFDLGYLRGQQLAIRFALDLPDDPNEKHPRARYAEAEIGEIVTWEDLLLVEEIDASDGFSLGVIAGKFATVDRFNCDFWDDLFEQRSLIKEVRSPTAEGNRSLH